MSREVDLGQIVPNIQVGTTTTGSPSTPASVVNVGTDLNPILNFTIPKGDAGVIRIQIVAILPEIGQEDTMYLLPLEEPESEENRYAEYIWVNGEWELLGKVGIHVDLTDYVKNTDYATTTKGGVVIVNTQYGTGIDNGQLTGSSWIYSAYLNKSGNAIISKGTLENVITGKQLETATNKVVSISSSSTDTQYPSAKCVYDLVGDIETILTTIDIGNGVA